MELISKDEWKKLATHIYDPVSQEIPPEGSIIYTEMEHIYSLFKRMKIECGQSANYILITANSDYSLVHQKMNPVWRDMAKWLDGFVKVDESNGYNPIIVGQRCNTQYCKIDDIISIKMYSYTGWTMNYEDIPESIYRWYSTNSCINNGFMTEGRHIPFGLPDWTFSKIAEKRKISLHKNENRKIPFFYSCSFNTGERYKLYNLLKDNKLVQCHKEPLSHDDYLNTLLQSKFVICPVGNGLDCYRTLEALYLGAIPIIVNFDNEQGWLEPYQNISMMTEMVNVDEIWEKYGKEKFNFSLDGSAADMLYWRDKIQKDSDKIKEFL